VGINTAIFSQSGGNNGIGFAIPINMAMQVMEQIVEKGGVQRGYVGVQVQDLNPQLADAFGLKKGHGAVINSVEHDSPADKAGLQPGDVITAINGKPVKRAWDVRNQIGLSRVGERVKFNILRNGKQMTLDATLASASVQNPGEAGAVNQRLEGVTVGDIEDDNPYYGQVKGVVVMNVLRGSQPWNAGLRKGDIITSVNRQPVGNLKGFLQLVNRRKGSLLLRIIRGNTAAFLVI
jgi:S1-C subfamily serine protease